MYVKKFKIYCTTHLQITNTSIFGIHMFVAFRYEHTNSGGGKTKILPSPSAGYTTNNRTYFGLVQIRPV